MADSSREELPANLGSTAWLPLESNPCVFDAFGKRVGLPDEWGFVDVLGLDEEMLELVPRPCAALILLFPCTSEIYRRQREGSGRLVAADSEEGRDIYFLSQHADAGNACGTFAALHAITNARYAFALKADGPLDRLLQAGAEMTPDERFRMLQSMHDLRERSDAAAEDTSAQTACPERDGPELEHHFVTLVCSASNRLIELDGTKAGPMDHGATSLETFVERAVEVVKTNFIATGSSSESIEFALMALVRKRRTR